MKFSWVHIFLGHPGTSVSGMHMNIAWSMLRFATQSQKNFSLIACQPATCFREYCSQDGATAQSLIAVARVYRLLLLNWWRTRLFIDKTNAYLLQTRNAAFDLYAGSLNWHKTEEDNNIQTQNCDLIHLWHEKPIRLISWVKTNIFKPLRKWGDLRLDSANQYFSLRFSCRSCS